MYFALLIFGGIGTSGMVLSGLAHGIGGHGAAGGHHGGAGHGLAGHHGAGHALPSHHGGGAIKAPGLVKGQSHGSRADSSIGTRLLTMISPLDIFMLAAGAGLTGVLLGTLLAPKLVAICACIGALLFDFGVIRPVIGLFLRFASNPAESLEGTVASTAEAVTRFDSKGRGLIKLIIDGQSSQVLATLDPSELLAGVGVEKGDLVVVTEVDPAKNLCRVSRELAPSLADVAMSSNPQVRNRS